MENPEQVHIDYNFRKAGFQDRDEIITICDEMGKDYLPRVIDNWLSMEKGGLYLLEDQDQNNNNIVAFCQIKFHTEDQAWLAGMRVRPDYQNLGAGSVLTGKLAQKGGEEGASFVRLTTTLDNYPAQKVGEKHGFYKNSRWRIFFHEELPAENVIKSDEPRSKESKYRLTWQEFPCVKDWFEQCAAGKFELELGYNRKFLFLTDFTFVGLSSSEVQTLDDKTRYLLSVSGEDRISFLGEETSDSENRPVFAINKILFTDNELQQGKGDRLDFPALIRALLLELKAQGYWGYTIAIPYQLWVKHKEELTRFMPEDEGEAFYLMERSFK
ncbi:GNAT family N-acetyltransferase [Natranaerobius thermophilus]|uniref:GCN5-related N-acetyltransferase n=1 Tax=Natranaerobius thermophilus (strain ATCC BAA-1301 / DSM 18059 / JW/NM-WN-LF) TaxID=457570 RepID=B2A0P4_NATTJ|nr:GNAT family N-acetyltransferase [Natranaerobius thermophilus]ACB85924.1 GCN5-related N-acetyltransferase [Natranaerobius thermophilus JW/NM-WN-LF]